MSRAGEDRTAASPRRYSVESFVPRRPCLEKISGIEKDAVPMMVGGGGRCPRTFDCVDVWRGSYWAMTALRERLTFSTGRFDRRGTQTPSFHWFCGHFYFQMQPKYKKTGPWKKLR
jgi:hypothetical protein